MHSLTTSRERLYSLGDLCDLMERLRDPESGCPWDIKQSFATIVPSTLEEAHEVADAIEHQQWQQLREELGDLLFQVIFYCQLGREENLFDLDSVIDLLVRKLIRRHPHVFPGGDLQALSLIAERDDIDVKAQWERIKQEERGGKGPQRVLDDIPLALPGLSRAQKLQKRAAEVGFDWPDITGVFAKLREEIDELEDAVEQMAPEAIQSEMGDLLFSVVNLSRHLKVDAETSVRAANQKFERRFNTIEDALQKQGRGVGDATLNELDGLWSQAKAAEREAKQGLLPL